MKAKSFRNQTEAERTLIAHFRQGHTGPCDISPAIPGERADESLHIRASLIRALVLGLITDVPVPDKGMEVTGAFIIGDSIADGEVCGLDLENVDLTRDLEFVRCYFPDSIVLMNARTRNLSFHDCHLAEGMQANQIDVRGNLFLTKTVSDGEIELIGARLTGCLDCTRAILNGSGNVLTCDRIDVKENLILDALTADGVVRLHSAKVGGDLDCEGVRLNAIPTSLITESAIIKGRWLWRKEASAKGRLVLTGAEFGTIVDDPTCFPSELLLDRCRYGGFVGQGVNAAVRIDWLSRMRPQDFNVEFWPHPYEECARALSDAGYSADARAVLVAKERLQRAARRHRLKKSISEAREKRDAASRELGIRPFQDQVIGLTWTLSILWLWDHLLGAVVDYGRRPGKAALWLGMVLLIGWFVFARAEGFGEIKPNLPQIQRAAEWTGCRPPEGTVPAGERWEEGDSQVACFLRQPEAASYPRFDALIYSADTLLPIVSLEMQSYWIPDDRKPLGRWARLYLWLHIFSGWGLTLLAVAGFSGLIKTDNSK